MDTLYTKNIPSSYKYLYLQDGYIYLFNTPQAENQIVDCYKIDNKNGYYFCRDTFEVHDLINFQEVNTSDKHYYRSDYFNILFTSCAIGLILLFITNIVTSFFKKGGVFSGLF